MIKFKKGYGALLIVMLIGVFLSFFLIGYTVRSQNQIKALSSLYNKFYSLNLAESCAEEVLLARKQGRFYDDDITLPIGTCSIDSSHNPIFRKIYIEAQYNNVLTEIELSMVDLPWQAGRPLSGILYWQQVR